MQKLGTLQFPSPSGLGFQVEKLIVINLKVGKKIFPYPFLGFFHQNCTKVNCSSCNISKQLVDFMFIKDTQPRSWNCKWLKNIFICWKCKKDKNLFWRNKMNLSKFSKNSNPNYAIWFNYYKIYRKFYV